jgi:uncharacterized protein YndB with AHSA1/START domain
MRILLAGAVSTLLLAGAAQAAATSTSANGFRLENKVTVAATPDAVWAALGQIGSWWSSDHTYSGSAANMTMPLKVGACFCEALPGGGVEHGRVIMVWPEQKLVRVQAALGPLQDEGVSAVLSFQVKPADGGAEVVETYNVGGARSETADLWPQVNAVLAEQLDRLKTYVEARKR